MVIVGSGPSGIRAASELLLRDHHIPIVTYGDEPWEPYDRVQLSSLLAGRLTVSSLANPVSLPAGAGRVEQRQCRVVNLDLADRTVIDARGQVQPWRALILATGSRPRIPGVEGVDLPGVFTFRDLSDVQALMARRARSRHTVVVGGGLLGLEAARAMQRANTQVTIVDHNPRLMGRQLDTRAAQLMYEHMLSLGVRCYLADGLRRIEGQSRIERVVLHSGRSIDCDTVILATGIRPNTELAVRAGLAVGEGIKVDDRMQASVPDVYAVGECAEHRGRVYGVVAPGLEQAAVAAHSVTGGEPRYRGSVTASRLKVVDLPVFSMGVVAEQERPDVMQMLVYEQPEQGIYRKLVIHHHRIVGAVAVGDWPDLTRLQEAITFRRIVWPWQRWRFSASGSLWIPGGMDQVANWPASAIVCNCASVCRGQLTAAIADGCQSVSCLQDKTRAATVCGSCKPLLAGLLDVSAAEEPQPPQRLLALLALAGLVLALLTGLVGPVSVASSFAEGWHISTLWLDGVWKQVSGYTMVALTLVGLLMSARKRLKVFGIGTFPGWRLAHVALGVATLVTLFVHTGLRTGVNLNQWLVVSFLLLAAAGSLAGLGALVENRTGGMLGRRIRRSGNWLHLLLTWPFPVLLAFHVIAVYYF